MVNVLWAVCRFFDRVWGRLRKEGNRIRHVTPVSWVLVVLLILTLANLVDQRSSTSRTERAERQRTETLNEVQDLTNRNDCRKDAEIRFFISVADVLTDALQAPEVPQTTREELIRARGELLDLADTCIQP